MQVPLPFLLGLIAIAMAAIGLVFARPSVGLSRRGLGIVVILLIVLPVSLSLAATSTHFEASKTTEFCLSCHAMEPYGETLLLDDLDHVPAAHFQNSRVPKDHACFSCHTTYTMYGDFSAKAKGMRHLWVNYVGEIPEKIELYEPYENRECLHCHSGARSFEEGDIHMAFREELRTGESSCLECHDMTHPIESLGELERWSGAQ